MSTQLATISTSEIMSIADSFAKSGMFPDIKSAAQAAVKIQAGKEFGIQPFAAMTGIHIIQGKPVIGAGLMASRVKGTGRYTYKVIKHDATICEIEYFELKKDKEISIGISTFTIEDARKAGTKNLDKFPKNMLFARAMSNGVKWYTPDIYDVPVYVPEEMEHLSQPAQHATFDVAHEEVKPKMSEEAWGKAVERIKNGEDLIGKIVERYELTLDEIAFLNQVKNDTDAINSK
jgi:hypothetical protein